MNQEEFNEYMDIISGKDAGYLDEHLMSKDDVLRLTAKQRADYARLAAEKYVVNAFGEETYDLSQIYVEQVSMLEGDWYLYTVAAKKTNKTSNQWSIWTLNLSTGGLAHGHYDINDYDVKSVLNYKRGGK